MKLVINLILGGMTLTLLMAGAGLVLYYITLPDEAEPRTKDTNEGRRISRDNDRRDSAYR